MWCYARDYREERLAHEVVTFDPVGEDEDPLYLGPAATTAAQNGHPAIPPATTAAVDNQAATDNKGDAGSGRGSVATVALDDDDFDPLASSDDPEPPRPREVRSQRARGLTTQADGDSDADADGAWSDVWIEGRERASNLRDWQNLKFKLINKFANKGQAAVAVSFNFEVLSGSHEPSDAASRLAALEDLVDRKRRTSASQCVFDQQEMVERLRLLNADLSTAWGRNERVTALKIVEKAACLLDDSSLMPSFYPATFTLVTEILDTLGALVVRSRTRLLPRFSARCNPFLPPPFPPNADPSFPSLSSPLLSFPFLACSTAASACGRSATTTGVSSAPFRPVSPRTTCEGLPRIRARIGSTNWREAAAS